MKFFMLRGIIALVIVGFLGTVVSTPRPPKAKIELVKVSSDAVTKSDLRAADIAWARCDRARRSKKAQCLVRELDRQHKIDIFVVEG